MSAAVIAYVGLGSNLDNPPDQIKSALEELNQIDSTVCSASSSLYTTPPMGPADQPDYYNAVAQLKTGLDPHGLLSALQSIEQQHLRKRERRWGPRTLDLDILLYGDLILNETDLIIPHPGLVKRSFVLIPLQEIAPDLILPGLGSIGSVTQHCDRGGIEKVS